MILIPSAWPKRSWWPIILEMLVEFPLNLPFHGNLLSQGTHLVHRTKHVHLHAFELSNNPSLRADFLRRLPPPLLDLREPVHWQLRRSVGKNSVIGVLTEV